MDMQRFSNMEVSVTAYFSAAAGECTHIGASVCEFNSALG